MAALVAMPQELGSSQKAKAQAILRALEDNYEHESIVLAMGDKWQQLLDGLSKNGQNILKQKLIGA